MRALPVVSSEVRPLRLPVPVAGVRRG
jgi:hypothetical protein